MNFIILFINSFLISFINFFYYFFLTDTSHVKARNAGTTAPEKVNT